ncbi:A1 cistron-splicing factor [Gorgonomyces haynaldii]|nr:A1 cistron-splicing factor [Gorgonomyces haynaldii]
MLVFLDGPQQFEFGLDFNSWQTGPKFRGLKSVPNGIHFVHYSLSNISTHGFFCNLKDMVVYKWDRENEIFVLEMDTLQLQRLDDSFRSYEQYLGSYEAAIQDMDTRKKWRRLSCYITPELIQMICPQPVSSMTCTSRYGEDWNEEKQRDLMKLAQLRGQEWIQPSQEIDQKNWINFTEIDLKRSFPTGSTGSQVTRHYLDKSWLLQVIVKQNFNDPLLFIGEMQIAFVLFRLAQIYDGFEHWKTIIHLLCHCTDAIQVYPQLYEAFLDQFQIQLMDFGEEFFVDELKSENFLKAALTQLAQNIREAPFPVLESIEQKLGSLLRFVGQEFGWQMESSLSDVDSEDLPQIVE